MVFLVSGGLVGDRTMTNTEDSRDSSTSQTRFRPTEAEVIRLLKETAQQYEEYIRLAELADIVEAPKVNRPRYDWDHPIGLVIREQPDAWLVRSS